MDDNDVRWTVILVVLGVVLAFFAVLAAIDIWGPG